MDVERVLSSGYLVDYGQCIVANSPSHRHQPSSTYPRGGLTMQWYRSVSSFQGVSIQQSKESIIVFTSGTKQTKLLHVVLVTTLGVNRLSSSCLSLTLSCLLQTIYVAGDTERSGDLSSHH